MMSIDTILVSGGAGFVGAHVNKRLHEMGYKTVVLDNLIRGHRDLAQWGDFVQGDVGDAQLLGDVFSRYPITDVVHLAAFAYIGESVEKPMAYWRNNFAKSLILVQECLKHGIERFVFSSTCATYGLPNSIPITEAHRQLPINPYGASKLAVEWMLRDFSVAMGLKYFSLRYFNAAGADQDAQIGERHDPETHIIPSALKAAHAQKAVRIFGTDYNTDDGTCVRDYVHVTDLAEAHVQALEYLVDGGPTESCNLGAGRGFSVSEVIGAVERVTGKNLKRIAYARRPGDAPVLIADIRKARRILGWEPACTELDSMVRSAWRWHRKDWHESAS